MSTVRSLDHFVLTVRDLDRSLAFYRDLLGLPIEGLEEYRQGAKPFVSLRIGESLLDLVPDANRNASAAGGFLHFCVTVNGLAEMIERLRIAGIRFLHDEPMARGGARGIGPSIYATDPDGYTVELKEH